MTHFLIIMLLFIFIILLTIFLHSYLKKKPEKRDWLNLFYAICFFVCLEIVVFYVGVDSFIGDIK